MRKEQVVAIEPKKVSRAVIRDTSISSEEREERIFFLQNFGDRIILLFMYHIIGIPTEELQLTILCVLKNNK